MAARHFRSPPWHGLVSRGRSASGRWGPGESGTLTGHGGVGGSTKAPPTGRSRGASALSRAQLRQAGAHPIGARLASRERHGGACGCVFTHQCMQGELGGSPLAMGFGESGEADWQVCSRTNLPDGADHWLDADVRACRRGCNGERAAGAPCQDVRTRGRSPCSYAHILQLAQARLIDADCSACRRILVLGGSAGLGLRIEVAVEGCTAHTEL